MREANLLLASGTLALLLASGLALIALEESARAAFPGQNGDTAFCNYGDGSGSEIDAAIYRIGADGSGEPERLSDTPYGFDLSPDYSADGTRIAFENRRGVHDREVYAMDADGSGEINLTNHPGRDEGPSWFPSGDRIAFQSKRDGNTDIYAQSLDPATGEPAGQPVRLTRNAAMDRNPAVSPDGKTVAFQSDRGDRGREIYAMRAAPEGPDNRPRALTGGHFVKGNPEWSPDGEHIAFVSNDSAYDRYDKIRTDIWKMRADGSNETRLTTHRSRDSFPAWSPDGRHIAFASIRGSNTYAVWKMRAVPEGPDNAPVSLTDPRGANEACPSWQPLP